MVVGKWESKLEIKGNKLSVCNIKKVFTKTNITMHHELKNMTNETLPI